MSEVRRRCVFYVSGFDPKGASHYHTLYKEQAALQEQVGGLKLDIGARRRLPSGNSAWTVRTVDNDVPVETHYEFMRWDDIVRDHWPRSQWRLWTDVMTTTLFNVRHGMLWKMFKLSWPPAVALFFPFVLLCAALVGIPVVMAATAWLVLKLGAPAIASGAISIAAGALLGWLGLKLEARYSMYWMMRSYAFTALQAQGRTPDLEARLDQHAAQLAQRLGDCADDEVLVVGHSSGAIMAASIAARALSAASYEARPVLSLLTLGQWIPLLGLAPQARQFRAELEQLATARDLHWIDFSAPPDGCCFALSDPVAACMPGPVGRIADRPKLLSPRFAEMFEQTEYAALRKDKFRMHFQYLMASQRGTEFDYFAITGGAATMSHRYWEFPTVADYRRFTTRMPSL
jgi:hypothetical protein